LHISIFAIQNALAGMIAHQDRLASVADRVSRWRRTDAAAGPAPVDMVKKVVEIKQSAHGFKANAAVARAADRMTGLLLDTYA